MHSRDAVPQFANIERWLGIPWVMNGEAWGGADCWGLVKLVYAHELGLELVHASESTTAAAIESARRLRTVKELILGEVRFRPVLDEAPWLDFDIVEIALGGGEADHVAIVAGGMLLQSRGGIGSHRAPIGRYQEQDRIRGAWRLV